MSDKTDNMTVVEDKPGKEPFPVKRLLLSVLASAAAFALFWCCYYFFAPHAAEGMADAAGVYALAETRRGDVTLAEAGGAGIASVKLDSNGQCRVTSGTRSLSGRWTLADGAVSLHCGGVKLTGTVDGGTLALNEVDSGDVTLIFTRGDAADSEAIPAGKYILTGIDDNGTQYTSSVLTAAESADWYISVNRLGRGKAVIFSPSAEEIIVDNGCIVLRGMRLGYTLDGAHLTVDYPGGITLTFEK